MIDENLEIQPKKFEIELEGSKIEIGETTMYDADSQFDFQDTSMDEQAKEYISPDDRVQAKKIKIKFVTSQVRFIPLTNSIQHIKNL